MPYKYTRRGKTVWRGQRIEDGRKIQRQFPTKGEALQWEQEESTRSEQQPTPSTSLLAWANDYLAYCTRYVPKTINEKANVFRRLFKSISPESAVSDFTRRDALTYLQEQFHSRSGYSANRDRKNLAAAWAYGARFISGFPEANTFLAVEKFPEQRSIRYVPTARDYWKVADCAVGQDKAMLLAALYLAARKGELFRLTWDDVDFESARVRLGTRKRENGSMEYQAVPMIRELEDVFLELKTQSESTFVFAQSVGRHKGNPYVENRDFPQALCRQAGVKPFGMHSIRHLTASVLAGQNVPMKVIQEILRHKQLATTERYVRGLGSVRPHLELLKRAV